MMRKIIAIVWTSFWFTWLTYIKIGRFYISEMFVVAGVCALMAVIGGGRFSGKLHPFAWDDKIVEFLDSTLSERMLLINLWIIIFLCWIPAWLAFFPGTFGYDSPIQLAMFMGDIELTSANPLLHTWLFGGIISLGNALFGSYQAGFALFVVIQLLLASNCVAYMALFLKKRRAPLIVILAGLIWTVSHPVIQILNLNSTKDIFCGIFLAYFTMAFWDLIEREERELPQYVKVFVLGLFACLMRNAIIFLFIILLVTCLLSRLKDKKMYLALFSTVLLVGSFSFVCGNVLRIPKADIRENFCIPIQQTATVAFRYLNGYEIRADEEDMAILNELYADMESLKWEYSSNMADFPKSIFQSEVFKSDPFRYISLYFKLGFQNPDVYYKSFLDMIRFYWNMSDSEFRFMALEYSFQQLNHWEIRRQFLSGLAGYREYLVEAVVSNRFAFWREPGLCIWLLAALTGMMIARRDRKGQLGILPILVYFVGILMGPIALLRYIYPMMLTTPLLFGMLFRRSGKDELRE